MEYVNCIAKTSFVNQWVGSVSSKQKLTIPKSIAEEFEAMGLVSIEGATPKKSDTPVQSNQSHKPQVDGLVQQSVLSPAETASPMTKSTKRGRKPIK